ncbi:hypothetical protein HRbin36_01238 [bacterium HR36]|nr:hypothetical protein HRbin36_01238 [bacterium HR36]
MRQSRGFTLIELLVVLAIIGLLMALLLPAIQRVREAANRIRCQNNLRQLGIALHNYEQTVGAFPSAYWVKPWPVDPAVPAGHYRWSTLALLTPYLEQTNVYNALDLEVPLFGGPNQNPPYSIFPQNRATVALTVPLFLCPSDIYKQVLADRGAANYVTCVGSGSNGGQAIDPADPLAAPGGGNWPPPDGVFYANSAIRISDIFDGTSNTALMSETLLGRGGPDITNRSFADPKTTYISLGTTQQLDSATCQSANLFKTNRQSTWADGAYPTALYNHWFPPNTPEFDCLRHSNPAWKAARSRHVGGVNVLMGDCSLHFVRDTVDLAVWRALATRAGGEITRLP